MFEYKSEILKISYKLLKASINEEEVRRLDDLINKRAAEGWLLVTYTFMGGSDNLRNGILVTFKKET
jgi:hypothetical protein